MLDKGVYYVVKRNLRREDRDEWASNIRSWCKNINSPREGKTVYIGSTFKDIHYISESGEEKVIRNRIVYEMTERTSMADGQLLLIPDVELNMFWTNLGDSDEDIIALYHAPVNYSNPNKQKDKFGALVSTWLRCRPRWAPAHRRPPPCPALTIIASFCLPDYLDCYNMPLSLNQQAF